jgi:hypothetical protein
MDTVSSLMLAVVIVQAVTLCLAGLSKAETKLERLPSIKLILSGEKERGQDYPICLQLEKILNLQENAKSFAKIGGVRAEIILPRKSKLFDLVKWEPVPIEVARSFFPDGELDKILESDKRRAVEVGQAVSAFEFEKATIEYDAHPPAETFLRYRYAPSDPGVCLMTQDAPNPARDTFNGKWIRGRFGHFLGATGCQFFTYGGRVYLFDRGDNIRPAIIRAESKGRQDRAPSGAGTWQGPYWYVEQRQLCSFTINR